LNLERRDPENLADIGGPKEAVITAVACLLIMLTSFGAGCLYERNAARNRGSAYFWAMPGGHVKGTQVEIRQRLAQATASSSCTAEDEAREVCADWEQTCRLHRPGVCGCVWVERP
jgi:hypothetical protein